MPRVTTYALRSASPAKTRADAVVVGVVAGPKGPRLCDAAADVSAAYGRRLRPFLSTMGVTGKAGEAVRTPTRDEVNAILKAAAESGPLVGVLDWSDEPLVSIDLMHTPASSTVDSLETAVIDGKLVRVVSWYDNEWGFSNRMVDTATAMAKFL